MYYVYGEVCEAVERVPEVIGSQTESTTTEVVGEQIQVNVKPDWVNSIIELYANENLTVYDSDDGATFVVAVNEVSGKIQTIKRRIQIEDVDELLSTLNDIVAVTEGEKERAETAEQALSDRIDVVSEDLENEVSRATTKEQEIFTDLTNSITAETQSRTEADSVLQQNINTEISDRTVADNTLRAKIEKEVHDREEAIAGIGTGIADESERAIQAEQQLAENITQANARAIQAENNLSSDITTERLRALSAEASLSAKIDRENQRAEQAEEELTVALELEEQRASNAEHELSEKIDKAIDALDYDDTEDSTKYVSEVDEYDGIISVKRKPFDPIITEVDGTSSEAPKLNITVADNTSIDTTLSKASTSIYGATKLTSTLNDSEETLATTPKYVDNKVKTLDVSDTADPTKYVSSVSETDGKISVSRELFNPSITIGAGTSSSTPTVNVTVAGNSGVAQSITTASTSVYGATRLTSVLNASEEGLAATPKYVDNAIKELDTTVSQAAGTDGLALSITETDGKITALTGSIASNTYDSYGDAAAVKTELLGDAATSYNTLGKLEDYIIDINSKIPAQATSTNQLADKAYVTDSVVSSAGFFRGSFATHAALIAVQWQTTDPNQPNYVSNNDYAYVEADETHNNEAWRYLFIDEPGNPDNGWNAQFKINNAPFTTAQMNAINSGITSALVTQIGTNQTNITNLQADKADKTATVSTVTYDTTNKKITKTINGTTTDVVSVATIKSDMDLSDKVDVAGDTMTGDLTLPGLIFESSMSGGKDIKAQYWGFGTGVQLLRFSVVGDGSQAVELKNIGTPVSDDAAANKAYVDDEIVTITTPEYDSTSTYDIDDVVIYNGALYKCNTAITTAEAWNSTHWTATNVVELIQSVVSSLSAYMEKGKDYVTAGQKSGTTLGTKATAEGFSNTVTGTYAHAEGNNNTASGDYSHVEGANNTASQFFAHAEGRQNTASGMQSHAEGMDTVASGNTSHAEGFGTIAQRKLQHVFGIYNIADTEGANTEAKGNYIEIVGNGTQSTQRSNARTLDWSGNQWNAGTIKIGGTSYDDTNAKEVATKEYVDNNMVILSYGNSIWQDFLDAYNKNSVVYCRASSNANPATGSQTRLAFMAYVNNADNPTSVEFQYYRSMSAHTISQQGDQVFVYKLDKTAGWTVTARETSAKIVAGTGLSSTYSNDTLTLTRQDELPSQSGQSGKFLTTNGTAVSWATVGTVNKYAETIQITTLIKTFIINHGLGTNDVVVNIYDETTGKDVIADITRSGSNGIYTLTIDFDATTPNGSYRVVVIG